MKTIKLPAIKGLTPLTPLQMNSVHFSKRHTLLTPAVLASLKPKQ